MYGGGNPNFRKLSFNCGSVLPVFVVPVPLLEKIESYRIPAFTLLHSDMANGCLEDRYVP